MMIILGSFLTEKVFTYKYGFVFSFFQYCSVTETLAIGPRSDSIANGLLLESFQTNNPRVFDFLSEWTKICKSLVFVITAEKIPGRLLV